ncbi:MAG: response regulator [Planctomycetes bacterium]|nr:response regulator [Planctomycetota bacterium]
MKILIAEDSFIARKLMLAYLSKNATCDVAINGVEAVEAFQLALEESEPYDLICLDICMPNMNGLDALKTIRKVEKEYGHGGLDAVKVIMTTAQEDKSNIMNAFNSGCEAYLVKPVSKEKLFAEIENLGLLENKT